MVNHTEIQYEKGDSCDRTDAPADQGCLVKKGSQYEYNKFIRSIKGSVVIVSKNLWKWGELLSKVWNR